MMDVFIDICTFGFKIFLRVVDVLSSFIFSWYYRGKQEKLPPIKSVYLLEPAHVLAKKIRRREVTSTEVIKAFIQRIEDVNPIINALVEDRFAEALEEAQYIDKVLTMTLKSEEKIAKETPLLGVPVTVKEAIAVKGCLFTVGCPARKGLRAEFDGDVVALLKHAGAIPIGVTMTPELLSWWESYNTLYGCCCNPYDTTRTPGGTSGGEGSILGSAGSVIGIGNDIGGSIRIPASFNGVFAHKPSAGLVSNNGQYPTFAPSLQNYLVTGPMCRYASDLLPLLKVLAIDHANKLKLNEKVDLHKLKIYYMENDGGNPLVSPVNKEIRKAQRKVLDYFAITYGSEPQNVNIPNMEHSFEIWSKIITTSDMKPISFEMIDEHGHTNVLLELFKWFRGTSGHILPVIISGIMHTILTPKDKKTARKYFQKLDEMINAFDEILGTDGIFMYPTGPDYALYHGQAFFKPFSASYTPIFNLLGYPVSQCPVMLSKDGLPIGLQVVSGLYNDHLTIAVAEEIEKAFGGWVKPPV